MEGGEVGVTRVWEKSSVGHSLERDLGQRFRAPGEFRKQRIRQRKAEGKYLAYFLHDNPVCLLCVIYGVTVLL